MRCGPRDNFTLTPILYAAGRIATRGGSFFKSALPAATTATAAYNADNQLTSWNGIAASYDLNGNLTNDGTRTLTWDARNRLTGITGVASFVYDSMGRRQSATLSGTTTTALYDGYDTVQEQSPVGAVSANMRTGLGVDERYDRYAGGTSSFYLTDLLGSTVALANLSGVIQTTYGYDPYGVTSTSGTANDNPYQFTGRQNDGTGLYYYRARYYNPVWGRFVSEDPIGLVGGINQYAYVGGDPIKMIDPMGLWAVGGSFYWGWGIGVTVYGEGSKLTGMSFEGGFGFGAGMNYNPCTSAPLPAGNLSLAGVAAAGGTAPGLTIGGEAQLGWKTTRTQGYEKSFPDALREIRGETFKDKGLTYGAAMSTKFGAQATATIRVVVTGQ